MFSYSGEPWGFLIFLTLFCGKHMLNVNRFCLNRFGGSLLGFFSAPYFSGRQFYADFGHYGPGRSLCPMSSGEFTNNGAMTHDWALRDFQVCIV